MSLVERRCPGQYCGRTQLLNDTWSDCGACPRGFRVNDYKCEPCIKDLLSINYDMLYLGFMMILPLVLHWFCIDLAAKERGFSKQQLILHFSAFCEVTLSAFLCIFFAAPSWTFKINTCGVERLSDFYTLFHNPTPNYEHKLHCTQEAVYPLQTIVLEFYLLSVVIMMFIRPLLNKKFLKKGKSAVYSALYFIPILSLIHAVSCGLIYYSFPYLSIILSMISNAAHFSIKLDQTMSSLFISSFKELKNLIIIIGHFLILSYGIISLHQTHLAVLTLVPLPMIFYIITVKFTDPAEFRERDREDRNN